MNEELLKVLADVMQKIANELKAVQTTNKQIQNSLATILKESPNKFSNVLKYA